MPSREASVRLSNGNLKRPLPADCASACNSQSTRRSSEARVLRPLSSPTMRQNTPDSSVATARAKASSRSNRARMAEAGMAIIRVGSGRRGQLHHSHNAGLIPAQELKMRRGGLPCAALFVDSAASRPRRRAAPETGPAMRWKNIAYSWQGLSVLVSHAGRFPSLVAGFEFFCGRF